MATLEIPDIAAAVRNIMEAYRLEKNGIGVAPLEYVATNLNVTPRTLQRRLSENGLSYRDLKWEIDGGSRFRVTRSRQRRALIQSVCQEDQACLSPVAHSRSLFDGDPGSTPTVHYQTDQVDLPTRGRVKVGQCELDL